MKNRYIAALLAFFLGGLGIHRFYLGKWNGIFYIMFCWTYIPTIIAFIETILYLTTSEKEFNEKYNKGYRSYQQQTPHYSEQNNNYNNTTTSPI